jgi:predicted protein tyrosine phosphatase
MAERQKLLFVCSQNKIRSLTAESLFRGSSHYEARSAGTEADARIKVTAGHIGWADVIFVMEKRHRERLRRKFRAETEGKRVITLFVPDEFEPMAPELIELLQERLRPYLDLSADGAP